MTFPADLLPHLLPDERELLERAQEAVGTAPWVPEYYCDEDADYCWRVTGAPMSVPANPNMDGQPWQVAHQLSENDARHIAAANPAAVIELLARLARERASRG